VSRPLGVMILGVLATLVGVMYIFGGFRLMGIVTFGPAESGSGVWFSGLLTLIVGVIWLGVGGALFSLQPWGLLFVEIMAIFALIEAVFTMFGGASQNTGWGLFVLPLVVLWYANRPSIKAAFAEAGVTTPV
jgi:hypothetical protein